MYKNVTVYSHKRQKATDCNTDLYPVRLLYVLKTNKNLQGGSSALTSCQYYILYREDFVPKLGSNSK